MFPVHKAKGTSSPRGAGEHEAHLHPQVKLLPRLRSSPKCSQHTTVQREEEASNAAPQHVRRHFSNVVFKATGGFLSAWRWIPQAPTAPAILLCQRKTKQQITGSVQLVTSSQRQRFPKRLSNRVKGQKSERSLGQKWHCTVHQAAGTGFDWRTRAANWEEKSGNFHHFSVSRTRWDTLATLLLQHLAEGEKSLMALSLPHQQCTTTAPGKKPPPLPTACNTESSASEKAELERPPGGSQNTQPPKAEQPASQRSRNLHESPRSCCIWAKARAILAGVVATVEKVKKLSELSLWSLKSLIHVFPLTFSTVRLICIYVG